MEDNGIMLPVISLEIKYKNSAQYDDELILKTIVKNTPSVRIEFDYELLNGQGVILATGNTVLVFIDMERNRPTRCPSYLLDKLNIDCLLYTSPSPRDQRGSRMPSSA